MKLQRKGHMTTQKNPGYTPQIIVGLIIIYYIFDFLPCPNHQLTQDTQIQNLKAQVNDFCALYTFKAVLSLKTCFDKIVPVKKTKTKNAKKDSCLAISYQLNASIMLTRIKLLSWIPI